MLRLYWFLPEEGSFIGWKKCKNNTILKLEIPSDAGRVCSPANRKCRAEFVKVLNIWNSKGEEIYRVIGIYNGIEYVLNEVTKSDSFDNDFRITCSHGIHFFLTRKEAEDFIY